MSTLPSFPTERTTDRKTIWVFTPSRTDPKDLEFILVQRQALLKDAVERVRESALTENKHHLLFVGPRGCGKTHLVTLIVSRLSADVELTDRLRIAWLNEDETCTSLLEFLVKVHAALEKRYPEEYGSDMLNAAYEMKPEAALKYVSQQLLRILGTRTLLVVTENLDALFEGFGDAGQKQFRSFIQENPQFSIVATAQRLVEDLSDRTSPFFGFFQTEHLKVLNVEEATKLLQNIAELQEKREVVQFLATSRGRSRVKAIHHLSGGNHRIYIVLAQFITRDSVDALLEPFMKMVDELTPYYQERIRWLPPLQRKIVEFLCVCEGTVPVKEIARRLFSSSQTISSQLQDLKEKGYVEASVRGRESLYEISEPLMRICVEVKDNQRHQPLRLLVDFLRVWYEDHELKSRLGKLAPASVSCAYLESAIQRNSAEGNLRKKILLADLQLSFSEKLPAEVRDGMIQNLNKAPEGVLLAVQSMREGQSAEAVLCLDEAISNATAPADKANLMLSRAGLHSYLGNRGKELADYNAVMELPGTPVEVIATAFLIRGLTCAQAGETENALADFSAVIGLSGASVEQVAQALYNRALINGKSCKLKRELDDYTSLIDLPGAPAELVAKALYNRGLTYGAMGEVQQETADYTSLIDLPGAPVEQVAKALFNRAITYGQAGEMQRELADYTALIDLPGASVDQVAEALVNRGLTHNEAGESPQAIADYTAVIELPGAPVEQVAIALVNRGITHGEVGERQLELADYTAAIELPDAPVEQVSAALVKRAFTHGMAGETQLELADYTAVIKLPGVPVELIALAFVNRGLTYCKVGETQLELADYTAVIELPGAPLEHVAQALFIRGLTYAEVGETPKAIADYTMVIDLPGAPIEQVAMALMNRGFAHCKAGDTQQELANYTAVIGLTGASPEDVSHGYYIRGCTYLQKCQIQQAQSDFEAVIRLKGAPVEKVIDAHLALAVIHLIEGRWREGFMSIEASLEQGGKVQTPYRGTASEAIGVIFASGLSPSGREDKVADLLRIYNNHQALPVLGEAVVQHVGNVFRAGEPFPSSDNLEGWASAWEQAAAGVPDFSLSMRLLRTGINYVKAGGKEPGILLDLTSTERAILEQALGLAEKDDVEKK